jgi:predicted nucleic acid-binding protein
MIVVSDTTPIISLMKAGQLEVLQKLFGIVCIPKAVYRELTENETFAEEVIMIRECEFLCREEVSNEKSVSILRKFTGLDAGESEAIILADEKQSDVLLMDEHRGRQVAQKMGIMITGTIGILTQAFDEGMLTKEDVEDCIERMKESEIRISEKLYQKLREHISNTV